MAARLFMRMEKIMNKVDPKRVGIAVGIFAGGMHAAWAALVTAGWAMSAVDYVERLYRHFIAVSYGIEPFKAVSALILIVIATLSGYVIGYMFSLLYNAVNKVNG